jgi:hypothetical protein
VLFHLFAGPKILRSSNGYEILLFCRVGDDGLEKLVTNHRVIEVQMDLERI